MCVADQALGDAKKTVTPRAAAFALMGMLNWIYQWYRPDGSLQEESLVQQYTEIFFPGGVRVSEVFALDELLAKRLQAGRSYLEFLRVPAMSAGVYVLPTGAHDPQQPHHQDEIYYVVRGKAKMRLGDERAEERFVGEGSIIFVEAGLEHRFFDVEEELVLLVVFAPEES